MNLTRAVVLATDGSGNRGSDPWKLYSIGLCQPENIFTSSSQSRVNRDILRPLPLASYIHPLYMSNTFRIYRIVYMTANHKNRPTTNDPARCAGIDELSWKERTMINRKRDHCWYFCCTQQITGNPRIYTDLLGKIRRNFPNKVIWDLVTGEVYRRYCNHSDPQTLQRSRINSALQIVLEIICVRW